MSKEIGPKVFYKCVCPTVTDSQTPLCNKKYFYVNYFYVFKVCHSFSQSVRGIAPIMLYLYLRKIAFQRIFLAFCINFYFYSFFVKCRLCKFKGILCFIMPIF